MIVEKDEEVELELVQTIENMTPVEKDDEAESNLAWFLLAVMTMLVLGMVATICCLIIYIKN